MTKEELKIKVSGLLPSATFDETCEWLNVLVEASDWLALAQQLRSNPEFSFDFLFCISGVDWKTHFSVVYHLRSLQHAHVVVVKAKCERANPTIESVCNIWRTAELNEREVYDLLGVRFLNHPDLRRLFLTDEWEGYPLRKDYVDEVNMIKL
jgi:NADH-quinone oxidoreductase subunit C